MKKIGKRSALIAALDSIQDRDIQPGEFTITDFIKAAKESGKAISRSYATVRLKDQVDQGRLKMRKTTVNGKSTNVYGPP